MQGMQQYMAWLEQQGIDFGDGLFPIWKSVAQAIQARRFTLNQPIDPEPTDHELRVGGIKRNNHHVPIHLTLTPADMIPSGRFTSAAQM
jgi:hypothetical protein